MRIAVDVMGSDNGPHDIIKGAVEASRKYNYDILLVGEQQVIRQELSDINIRDLSVSVVGASDVIDMHESPAHACRQKKDSSIMVAMKLLRDGNADAIVSAGNSGATMAAALMILGRLKGIRRPAIASPLPSIKDVCTIIDVGANVDCKPKDLVQFAIMGNVYMKYFFKKQNPAIGLLSIGEEPSKGNELTLATYKLLKSTALNFIGNIEGRDIAEGKADVVVCDGFTGNIILKFAEGLAFTVIHLFKKEFTKSILNKILILTGLIGMKRSLKNLNKRIDYTEYGGAPLLGVNGVCIISHGISNARAITSAVHAAGKFFDKKINEQILNELKIYL